MIRNPPRRISGATLIELMLAIAIVVISILILYNARMASFRAQADPSDNEAAADSVQRLNDALANYVTADYSAATAAYAPNGSWQLPGDTLCAYALDTLCVPSGAVQCPGQHNASQFIAPAILAKHPNATLCYTVAADGTTGALSVTFNLQGF